MNKFAVAGVAVGVILIVGWIGVYSKTTSDEQLIKDSLAESIRASKEGRPGGVLEILSRQFQINGQTISNETEIARYIRDTRPNVEVLQPDPFIQSNVATIKSDVKLSMPGPFSAVGTTLEDVELKFQKESTMKWLIFPDRQWKLVEVKVPNGFTDIPGAN